MVATQMSKTSERMETVERLNNRINGLETELVRCPNRLVNSRWWNDRVDQIDAYKADIARIEMAEMIGRQYDES